MINLHHLRQSIQKRWILFIGLASAGLLTSLKNVNFFSHGEYFFLFFGLIAIATGLLVSTRVGLAALSGSLVTTNYFFIPPYQSFEIANIKVIPFLLGSYIFGVIILFLILWIKKDAKSFTEHH